MNLDDRFDILVRRYGFSRLDARTFGPFSEQPGATLILFVDNPERVPESWDLTVILPECVSELSMPVSVGMLPPQDGRLMSGRFGITIWPALLVMRDGEFLGTIEGLKDWEAYRARLSAMFAGSSATPPGVVIPIRQSSPCGDRCA